MEQRKVKRFELKLPVRVLRHGVRPFTGSGETTNLSSRGVHFCADAKMEVGESIEYIIRLPAQKDEAVVDLRCLGKVVRAVQAMEKPGAALPYSIAATLERYEFIREKN